MYIRLSFLILMFVFVFQGCAPVTVRPTIDPDLAEKEAALQRKMAIEERVRLFSRLSDVAHPILVNGTPLCGDDVTYFLGMDTNSIDAIPEEWRAAYREVLGLGERIKVTRVLKNSPAEKGGFRSEILFS